MSETYIHKDYKSDLYWSFAEDDEYAEVEKRVGHTVTDILAGVDSYTIAIEIQHTRIPIHSILRRMREHTAKGMYTLWIITPETILFNKGIRSLKWVMFIQKLQNGVIFLPTTGKRVIPARIDNSLCIKDSEITAGRKWLDAREEVEIENLVFGKNDKYGLNVISYLDFWSEDYYNFLGDFL